MSSRSAVFANPARTAIGTFGGSLKEVPAPDLGAAVIKAALERAGLKPDEGWHTEDLVQALQIGRDVQDQWALRSQQRFAAAHSMRRDGLQRGIVTLCIGGGQGIALAIEMIT
ncbi:MAG: hypothetical protein JOZ21_15295 [Verrucomicrobia bacterium]|nr:hypothetical protein [Verrucomicrobiota bacterium]